MSAMPLVQPSLTASIQPPASNEELFWKCLPGGREYLDSKKQEAGRLEAWMVEQPAVLNLKDLEIRNVALTCIPAAIGICTQLKRLAIIGTLIEELPSEIGALTQLQELNLSHNSRLSHLCPEFQKLRNLDTLHMECNQLVDIDPVGPLEKLTSLNANGNRIERLPSQMRWIAMQSITLGFNRIRQLPESFYDSIKLDHVSLHSNKLEVLSERIFRLQKLRMIDLTCNQLTRLPQSMAGMERLEQIYCSQNPLS